MSHSQTHLMYFLLYLAMTTIVIDIDNKRELPLELVYVGTLLIDREKGTCKLVS